MKMFPRNVNRMITSMKGFDNIFYNGCNVYNPYVGYGGIFLTSLSDNYVDLSDLYVDLSDHYVDLSEKYHHIDIII